MVATAEPYESLRIRTEYASHKHQFPNWLLVASMVAAIAGVAALAYWDGQREADAALDDFAREQAALAAGTGLSLQTLLATIIGQTPRRVDARPDLRPLFASLQGIERDGRVHVLLRPPSRTGFVTSGMRQANVGALERAFLAGQSSARLHRAEATLLGLPASTAIAGLSAVDAGQLGQWGVAVVSSAQHERDRETRANRRLLLAVGVAAGLVLVFGGIALRKQRTQLELSHELAVASMRRARDERLVQADKLATLGALATGIAHEVSTPLGVILGRAEQLASNVAGDDRATRAVKVILEQTDRISHVIRGFLSLARGNTPRLEHVDPAQLVHASVELVEHRFLKAKVELTMNIAAPLPQVACQPRLFEQVLVNLLLNACDSCQQGGHVELALRADGKRVAFVITDDGHGIAPEAAARVTEPFFTTKPEGQGTGLGLAIANEIVKHHHGTLAIAPREHGPWHGTRAVVDVPRASAVA